MALAAPQFSPKDGVGSTVDYNGTKWAYTQSGWTPIQQLSNQNMSSGLYSGYAGGGSGGGGGLSWGSTPAPKTTTQSSGYPSNPNVGDRYGGERWNGVNWEQLGPEGPSGPSEADMAAMVDAQYAPAAERLSFLESEYKAQQPLAEQSAQTQYSQGLTPIETAQTSALSDIGMQRQKGQRQERGEISKARNLYQQLMQQAMQRFGGSSSAAMAAQELLGRDVSRQLASVREGYGDFYKNLQSEEGRIKDFYNNKKIELKQNLDSTLNNLRAEFESKIREINSQRNVLEANKSYAKLQMLQAFSQQAQAMRYEAQQYTQQLEQWKALKDNLVAEARSMGAKSVTVPGIPDVLGQYSMTFGSQGGGSGTGLPQGYYKVGSNIYSNVNGVPTEVNTGGTNTNDEYDWFGGSQ